MQICPASARAPVHVSDADLREAWRYCHLLDISFEAAMQNVALSIAIRHVAECTVRRKQRQINQHRFDYKRAQANDLLEP
jgi:hypothetical protein